MDERYKLEDSWLRELRGEFDKEYMFNLREFLIGEMKMGKNILPEPKLWFNALNITPLDSVKVVIIGQDPYPTIGHPHGLSFSVLPDVNHLPKSFILPYFTEMRDDIGYRLLPHGAYFRALGPKQGGSYFLNFHY